MNKKILIVEDEFIIAHRIKELLENNNIASCLVTDTYNQSIDRIKKDLPDLALLDICLFEDKDAGIRLARYLQGHYNIPYIFLSGYSDEITLRHAKPYRPATFITKPLNEKQLLAAVSMALPEEGSPKARSVFLKGRYLDHISYEKLGTVHFSEYDFVNRAINFDEVTIIQSFNHIKRNTILFKFRQPDCFFVMGATIEKIQSILPHYFEQVHQSFIINTHYISAKRGGHYITILDENVPVGAAFKNTV